jgi:DNA-binding NtrC family response regulator
LRCNAVRRGASAGVHAYRLPPSHREFQMLRVLVIDDESYVRSAIKIALPAGDYDVHAVENGKAALKAFGERAFDLAIVDILMMDMDGMTLINALRARAPDLPVVVISGGSYGTTAIDILRNSGLPGLVCRPKPFRPAELIHAVQQAMNTGCGPPVKNPAVAGGV